MKLFRSILPIFFFFLSLGAVAQMDNNGNFHWDELYTPDEVLELDMSLPNKVDVSAIKNRERVKYVKLRCYPWIEHIPFTPEDFPNIEALRIETYLLVDLRNLELFTGLKRLGVTEPNCIDPFIRVAQMRIPQPYANRVWSLSALEELDFSMATCLMVSKTSLSKMSNLHYFKGCCGAFLYEEVDKMQGIQSCSICKNMHPLRPKDKNPKNDDWLLTYYTQYEKHRRNFYYNTKYGRDTVYECVVLFDEKSDEIANQIHLFGTCWINDSIYIFQDGRISGESERYREERTLCIYCPSQDRLVLLDLACWDEYTPFYFLEIDYKNNILTSLCGGDNDYNYIVEDNKVYVNEKYTGYLGFPAYGTYGEVDCKEPEYGHKFDYFELLDGTSQINELKLKRAQMFNSYEKEYEKQIKFAKNLKSLECMITKYKKQ